MRGLVMNIALVLSGGTGTRLGADIPKQYIEVNGRMIIDYCLETFFASEYIDAVWIVADESWQDKIVSELREKNLGSGGREEAEKKFSDGGIVGKLAGFSVPGKTRQLSILNGLEDIRSRIRRMNFGDSVEVAGTDAVSTVMPDGENNCDGVNILIHDAARPLLTRKLISDCFAALPGHDGVMPVLPMKDTVYVSNDGKTVDRLLDRSTIYAGQAPELYRLKPYYEACVALLPQEILSINGSTEPAIRAGLDVAMIPGDEGNYKITTKNDLEKFETKFLNNRE
jgi:2-C-methyl-D-erythritol 4-phosphate cytidylyltransferase